ncbi:MAG: FtsX-like permease family protein [Oscillospiraceae bacterium]|jgi:putative ABC transport system permease protein|nr:FtsX-like permease family protein [Oscillospiraceae bacterium]
MVARKNRLTTDAVREIRHTLSRFLSILVLAALAVAFLAGLRATAPDMKYTADRYYDRTGFMDGWVLSTLGLTQEDLDALSAADGVEEVEGAWSVDATAVDCIVSVRSLPERLNLLEVKRGRLPEAPNECVTEGLLLVELGLEVGDTLELTLEEENEGDLTRTSYTIVGVVNCPLYVGTDRGTSSLGSGSVDAFLFVPGENFTYDYYTAAYFTGEGLRELDSYGDEYEDRAEALLDSLEPLGSERAEIRYETLVGDAQTELDEAQAELDDARAEADQELADGRRELDDARKELDQGWADYREGRDTLDRELDDARRTLADAARKLNDAQAELDDGRAQYEDGLAQYREGLSQYEDGLAQYQSGLAQYQAGLAEYERNKAVLDGQQAQVNEGLAQYEAALKQAEGTPAYEQVLAQLAEQKAQLDRAQAQLDAGYAQLAPVKNQLDGARAELDGSKAVLDGSKAELDSAKAVLDETERQLAQAEREIAAGWRDYRSGQAELAQAREDGERELADALDKLEDGEAEYAGGLKEYEDGKAEADGKIADAQQKLDDARDELDQVEECQWYILGRNTNVGFVSFAQDTERVSNLATIFPVIFFLVAALACLTTMTRMVEEQRTEIGALKAMGFSRLSISKKYIGYAFLASLLGGVIGLGVGATLIPAVVANAFGIMYAMPPLEFREQNALCVLSVLAAVACTTGAALWACLSTLMAAPANLMRPKAPKAGKRVFLERVRPVWRRLSFTWKVTMRNLFRYQRRFWMTVIGIGGCTALIVTGFGLHESIFAILNKQFDEISLYDATAGLDEDAAPEELAAVTDYLDGSGMVEWWHLTSQTAAEASAGGMAYDVGLYAIDDFEGFTQFMNLRHRKDGGAVTPPGDGAILTEKLSELLGVEVGDTVTIDKDGRVEVRVDDIVEHYVQHNVYLSAACYERLFGEAPAQNLLLLEYGEGAESDQVSAELMAMDAVTSHSYIAAIRDSFTNSMEAIDYAVVIIILSAAALAFVVLYNLTNINITERVRELATLKVLGFFDKEITAYVYRENVFLTLFGIVLGLVMGRLLHAWLVLTVEVDLVMFGRTAPAYAYVLAAVLTAVFSVMVNVAAHFKLKKVDMVESLKTVE